MISFIPNIFNNKKTARLHFNSVDEALEYIVDLMNKQDLALEESYKILEEAVHKNYCVITTSLRLLCDKFGSCSTTVDYEELLKQARAEVNNQWPKIKKEIAEERAAQEAAVNELIELVQTFAQKEGKTKKEG